MELVLCIGLSGLWDRLAFEQTLGQSEGVIQAGYICFKVKCQDSGMETCLEFEEGNGARVEWERAVMEVGTGGEGDGEMISDHINHLI